MQRRYYRRKYYRRTSLFENLIDLLATLYIFYLGYLYFIDRANFYRWLIYGVTVIVLCITILFAIDRFKNRKGREIYFPYRKYFKPKSTPEAIKLGNLLKEYGWYVEFEKWDGYKHIDIAITEARFNIEVEGSQHNLNSEQAFTDLMRDYYSEQKGFVTKRISNSLLRDDVTARETAKFIDKQLQERVVQLKE